MKLQPSETMTVDTLAAEIQRQADHHTAADYPFPALTIAAFVTNANPRIGRVEVSGAAGTVVVTLAHGIAYPAWIAAAYDPRPALARIETAAFARPGTAQYLGECLAECSTECPTALTVIEQFHPGG